MPWIRFTRDIDFSPKPSVTIAYKQGMRLFVTRAAAQAAIGAGAAVASSRPRKTGGADAERG